MGILFVILFHLIGIFILCSITGIISAIITYWLSGTEKRKRKITFAVVSPFIALYTLYFTALVGSIIISSYKNIDVGIGDVWYVPLSDNCELLFIDLPEQAFLQCGHESLVSDISRIGQDGNNIYCETYDNEYFLYNTISGKLIKYTDKNQFTIGNGSNVVLKNAIDFYSEKRNDIAGLPLLLLGAGSVLLSITFVIIAKRIIVGPIAIKRKNRPKAI